MPSLEGKSAIITGAASGIGAATATRFIEEGATVVLADVSDEAGEALAAELGDAASYIHCNVANPAEIAQLIEAAVVFFDGRGVVSTSSSTTPASAYCQRSRISIPRLGTG